MTVTANFGIDACLLLSNYGMMSQRQCRRDDASCLMDHRNGKLWQLSVESAVHVSTERSQYKWRHKAHYRNTVEHTSISTLGR